MIKKIDKITIGDFHKMELTGKIYQYKCWYNILPLFIFSKRLQKLAIEIETYINDNKLNDNALNSEWQAESLNKINRLEIAYNIAYHNLVTIIELKLILKETRQTRKEKRRIDRILAKMPNNLSSGLATIKEIYGIDPIAGEEIEFLEKVRKEIVRRKDKYNENFKSEEQQNEGKERVYIMSLAGRYQGYFGQSTLGIHKMTIIEFKALRDNLIKDIEEKQKQLNKIQ